MKKRIVLSNITAGLVSVLLFASIPVPAGAVTNTFSITLSPVVKNYELNPGETIKDQYMVFNSGQLGYDFSTYPNKFSISGENYDTYLDTTDPMADVNEWIQVGTPNGHLEGGKYLQVPFTLTVPANATPGAHTGVIFAQNVADTTQLSSSGIMTEKRVGMTVYVNVKGNLDFQGSASVDIPFIQTTVPIHTYVRYSNDGNAYYVADTTYQVYTMFGKQVYDSGSLQHTILPERPRKVALSWDGAQWFGVYKVGVSSTILGDTTTKSSYVLVMPIWLMLLIGLTIVAGGAYAVSRSIRHRRRR